jgi:general secretion pathway protein L
MALNTSSYRSQNAAPGNFAGVARFLRWWIGELKGLVPLNWRPLPRPVAKLVWLEFAADEVVLHRVGAGKIAEVGRVSLVSKDASSSRLNFNSLVGKLRNPLIGICIPADQVLRKEVSLPLAAQENLRQVLAFELNRHTPFNADQAYFDYRVLGVYPKTGLIHCQLTVAARRQVDEAIAFLMACGQRPQAIVPVDDLVAEPRYANLLPRNVRPRTSILVKLAYSAMILSTVVLVCAALLIPIWQKREVAAVLDGKVAKAKQDAAAVESLQQELSKTGAEYQFLLEKKSVRPATVALVEEITRLLPDDTWLSELQIKGGDVVMNGETSSSTGLIRTMGKSSLLDDAAFSSPVVKGRNNVERFQMGAKIKATSLAEAFAKQKSETGAPQPGKSKPEQTVGKALVKHKKDRH